MGNFINNKQQTEPWYENFGDLKILNKLQKIENSFNMLEISKTPNSEGILQIIDYLKAVEQHLNRWKSGSDGEKHTTEYVYVNGLCYDLASLIQKVYNYNEKLQGIEVCEKINDKCEPLHYLIEFDKYYYDINGKSTKKEIIEFCKKEFIVTKIKFNKINKLDKLSDVTGFCLRHIKSTK